MKIRMLKSIAGSRYNGIKKGKVFDAVLSPAVEQVNSPLSKMKRYAIKNQEGDTSYVFENEVEVLKE